MTYAARYHQTYAGMTAGDHLEPRRRDEGRDEGRWPAGASADRQRRDRSLRPCSACCASRHRVFLTPAARPAGRGLRVRFALTTGD